MIGKPISHYKMLEKLGEGGTCPVGQYSFRKRVFQ